MKLAIIWSCNSGDRWRDWGDVADVTVTWDSGVGFGTLLFDDGEIGG